MQDATLRLFTLPTRSIHAMLLFLIAFVISGCALALGTETSDLPTLLGYPDDDEKHAAEPRTDELVGQAEPFSDDKWHFGISPYAWIPAIRARVASSDINIHNSDIIDNLDFAYMLSVEARRNRWGFFVDTLRMDLEDDENVDFFRKDPRAKLRLTEGIIQPGVFYRFGNEDMYVDAMASVRFFYLEIKARLGNAKTTFRESWFESAFGLRGSVRLADRWRLAARGGVGGFSIGEASQLTWQGMGFIGFDVSEPVTLFGGYRFYSIDYNDAFDFKERIMGPVVGAQFSF